MGRKQSAKQRFIEYIEKKILSGELAIQQKLPPERELAEQTGYSRVTVHAGLIELASKNVLQIIPRQGTFVNDFKKEGTLELYGALLQYTGKMEKDILYSLIEFRELVETAGAGRAANHRTEQNIIRMKELLQQELAAQSVQEAARLDYLMHLEIAKASANIVLPMTLRSIEAMYMSLVGTFYSKIKDRSVVYAFHAKLIAAIEDGDGKEAEALMKAMLGQGRDVLLQNYASTDL